jgi:hypothetical protein
METTTSQEPAMTATTSTRCDRCHADCPEHHVTVQRDGEALCYRCVDEFNEAMRAARKRDRLRDGQRRDLRTVYREPQ